MVCLMKSVEASLPVTCLRRKISSFSLIFLNLQENIHISTLQESLSVMMSILQLNKSYEKSYFFPYFAFFLKVESQLAKKKGFFSLQLF